MKIKTHRCNGEWALSLPLLPLGRRWPEGPDEAAAISELTEKTKPQRAINAETAREGSIRLTHLSDCAITLSNDRHAVKDYFPIRIIFLN